MSTTIDSLDIQISTSAGKSAQVIGELATELGRLKDNGKITVATNGLKKLADALNTLNPALNGMNAAKLQQLRGALSGLANLQKLAGLDSAVKTLKKIPDVVNGLSTAKLDEFEQKMERLSIAIGPLAAKIDRMGSGFAKLPNYVGKAVTVTNRLTKETEKAAKATEKHSVALDKQSINVMSAISNFESMLHVVQMVGNAFHSTMAQAMEWDGIQYRFGRAFGEDAEEVYAYAEKINDVLGINIQQFMQYSSLYGSLLSGFGLAQDKVTTISVGLTELSYDIWAAYNDRFKTLEDASEAVRSAITGEIEPIRNAGIALTEASLQEYLEQIGMATVSIEQLSESQKAEVRYAAMMNAAMNQGIVGTYAKEMQTAEGAVRNLSQAWKTLVQAFGSLFIPILQAVIPYLTAFVNLLTEAVHWVANLFNITLFEIDWGNTGLQDAVTGSGEIESNLNEAAEAAKKIKNYTMGFDELNVFQPTSSSSTGGAGGTDSGWGNGLDLETLWDNSVFTKASQQVDELKQKIKDWFNEWKTELAIIGSALGALSMANVLGHLGEALELSERFMGNIKSLKQMAGLAIILTIQYSLMSEYLENFIETGEWESYVWAAVVGALGAFGSYLIWGTKGLILSLSITALVSLKSAFADGSVDSTAEVVTGLTGIASAAGAVAIAWPKLKPVFDGIVEFFKTAKQMAPEVGWLAALFPKLSGGFASIGTAIGGAVKAVLAFVGGISAPVWGMIVAVILAIASVVVFLKRNWEEVTAAVKGFFETNIVPKLEEIKESWEKMKSAVSDILPPGVIQWFKDAGEWIWNLIKKLGGIGDVLEWLGGVIFSVVGGSIAAIFSNIVQVIQGVIKYMSGFVQVISGFVEFWIAVFTGDNLLEPLQKMWSGIKDIFGGMYDMTIGVVVNWVKSIIDWCTELWDELVGHSIIPDMINAIIDWFKKLPSKAFESVKEFTSGVISRIEEMWDSIVEWFNTNVAPKFTLSYWKNLFGNVKEGASSKLAEVKKTLSEKWSEIKSWWNSDVSNKLSYTQWKNKFNGMVTGLGSKLDEAWTKVKNFFSVSEWKKKVNDATSAIKDNFKMPTLPKIKLDVSYDTNVGKVKKAICEALGLDGWPNLKWSTYAQGGFPSMGEMFIAREAGPELVGQIGNRTTVANNDQIVEAVSAGVYSAVVAAMNAANGGGTQAVNVYLDGKQITASVEKRQMERGATLMTGGMVYGY
jgi:hypothetical protein